MRTWICYPMPMDSPEVYSRFLPAAQRFADKWRSHPPGADCLLAIVCNHSEPSPEVQKLFARTGAAFWAYPENGCDMGSAQYLAYHVPQDFIVAMTSRSYPWRSGWLVPVLDARRNFGPGLYGLSGASREGSTEHLCLRSYAMDARLWNEYPIHLNNRALGPAFEAQMGLANWLLSRNNAVRAVYWRGSYPPDRWFEPENRFRNGDQSDMLIWDRHSDGYRDADPETKARLEHITRRGGTASYEYAAPVAEAAWTSFEEETAE
jgi:hypothetical protein